MGWFTANALSTSRFGSLRHHQLRPGRSIDARNPRRPVYRYKIYALCHQRWLCRPGGSLYAYSEQYMGLAPILVAEAFRIDNGRISVHGPAESLRSDPAVKAAYLGGSQ